MVRINRVYTGNGDDGETHLVGGQRIAKDDVRVQAYGEVDEVNSTLGIARTIAEKSSRRETSEIISQIQNELFDAGAELATPANQALQKSALLGQTEIKRLEETIDALLKGLPELASFVLPGGSELNATLHLARTVCRRAERAIVRLSHQERVRKDLVVYFNRLGDLLFTLARSESATAGIPEYLWTPKR